MYQWFYWFVPFSNNDDLWIKFLSPLIFIAFLIGVVAAFVFVYTRTNESNSRKQNNYWWIIYIFCIVVTSVSILIIKSNIENSLEKEDFSYDFAGILTAIAGSCIYSLITYYIFTNIFRRMPRNNPKRYLPTFVIPHSPKLNSKL